MEKNNEEVIAKLEGYLKFKRISKKKLAEMWEKTEAYIYRRFSCEVELTLTDIKDLCKILKLTHEEILDIFF
ncbi:MAG: helix-turn-helix domain-containing protein [Clostridia bacterium]